MRTVRTLAALVGGLLVCSTAASAATINGYTWDNVFTGDQIPLTTDSNWTVFVGTGTSASHVDPGTITLDSPLGGSVYASSKTWAPSATAYAEFKVKIERFNPADDDHPADASGASLDVMSSVGGGMQLYLRNGAIGVLDNNGVSNDLYSVDTTEYHVYRVAANTSTGQYSVYVDNMSTPVIVNQPLHAGLKLNILRFGDPGSNIGGKATFEYVAFNNSSAPTQIPEPSAGLVTMGIVGAAALVRRRRAAEIA